MTTSTPLPETSGHIDDDHSEEIASVLAHPVIKALAEQYGDHLHTLSRCVKGIVNESVADLNTRVEATTKAFHAATDKLRIFISYKRARHLPAAQQLKNTLDAFGNEKVDVFLDTESISFGENWFLQIGEALKEANCLLLLVPDADDEREWPIFEAGYFAGQILPGERLICLHHKDVPVPKQINMFNATVAIEDDIQKLLADILVHPGFIPGLDAINPKSENSLASSAASISALIDQPQRLITRHTMNFVKLQLASPGVLVDMRDLLAATVLDCRGLDELFSYNGGPYAALGDVLLVEDGSLKRHEDWLKEITKVVQAEMARRKPPIPFAKFSKADQTRFFRPVVRLVEEEQNQAVRKIHRIEVAFGEHLVGPITNPDGLQIMEAVIRMSARFRMEIIRPFEYAATPIQVDQAYQLLSAIEREASDEGLRNRALVSAQFKGERQEEINRMYDHWETFRNDDKTGYLDKAFAERNPTELQKCLKELRANNHRLLELASERYAEMVKFLGS
jgi:TIR domain